MPKKLSKADKSIVTGFCGKLDRWNDWLLVRKHIGSERIASLIDSLRLDPKTHGRLCFFLEGIKIDMLHHPFPLLEKIQTENEFRLYSLRDVSAMKINAVTNRGAKKDFVDLYVLHQTGRD